MAGERATVEPLLTSAASPHTHDPRPSNARSAARSTALFYGAPTLDAWAAELDAPHPIAMLSLVPDSMRLRLPANDATDPHFWLDPLAVQALLPALADTLCSLDAGGCEGYRARARTFAQELDSLHGVLEKQMAPLRGEAIIVAHPFLHYFAHRYGIEVAAVVEPSPGSEPSPRAVQRLVEQARADGVRAVVSMPQHPSRAARAVAEGASLPLVQLDPIGGEPGRSTYDELLRYNARQLTEALR